MKDESFEEAVETICREDSRYPPEAYHFVREALDFTARNLQARDSRMPRHLTGQELTEGIRVFALREFGPMALTVLQTWRLNRTEDFGEIVFNLVDSGKLGKQESDKREDFANGYDFVETFARPYEPRSAGETPTARRRRKRRPPPRAG